MRVLLGSVGRGVEVQLGLTVELKLQPSVVSDSSWVFAAEGGYSTHLMLMHKDAAIPDIGQRSGTRLLCVLTKVQ